MHLIPTIGRGATHWNFTEIFGIRKLESLYGVACVILCLAVSLELRLATDGQTERATDKRQQHIPC